MCLFQFWFPRYVCPAVALRREQASRAGSEFPSHCDLGVGCWGMPCTPSAGQALQHLAQSLPCTALRLVGKRASMGVGVRGRHVPVPPPPPPSLAATLGNSVINKGASLVAQTVKNLPAMQETWVRSFSWEDPLEKRIATPVCLPGESHGYGNLVG